MSDSGSEYLPSEDEEEEQETAEEEEEWGARRLGGADDGYTTGATTGSEYEDDDLFDAEAGEEPFALLESLNKQQVESQSMGAYQLLRNKRGRGRPRKVRRGHENSDYCSTWSQTMVLPCAFMCGPAECGRGARRHEAAL